MSEDRSGRLLSAANIVPAKSDSASVVDSNTDVVGDPPSNLIMIGDSTLDINETRQCGRTLRGDPASSRRPATDWCERVSLPSKYDALKKRIFPNRGGVGKRIVE